MKRELRRRSWIETALAATTAFLAVLTLFSREWIEIVFGVDPDKGSGQLEWLLVVVMLVATVSFSLLARHEFRRSSAPARVERFFAGSGIVFDPREPVQAMIPRPWDRLP